MPPRCQSNTTDGGKCTFKEYLKDRGLFASKFYVYLMTTAIEDESMAARVRQNDLCSTVSSYKSSLCSSTCNEVADLDIQEMQVVSSTPKNSVSDGTVENQRYGPALGDNLETLSTVETMREHSLGIMYEVVKESSYSAEVVISTVLKDCAKGSNVIMTIAYLSPSHLILTFTIMIPFSMVLM